MRYFRCVSILLLAVLPSCAYFADRGVDFLDQYRIAVGATTGGGIRVNHLGLFHTGVNIGAKFKGTTLGWKYGRPLIFTATPDANRLELDQSYVVVTSTMENWDMASNEYKLARTSSGVLPAFFSWVDTTYRDDDRWYVPEDGVELTGKSYIWSGETWRNNRYAMIHAFDVEFEIGLLVYLDTGWSPGETLDFLLGILTIDLAKDDGRILGGE